MLSPPTPSVPFPTPRASDEPHDLYEPYTPPHEQHQQRQETPHQSLTPTPTDSTSGTGHTLRRTPRLEQQQRRGNLRTPRVDEEQSRRVPREAVAGQAAAEREQAPEYFSQDLEQESTPGPSTAAFESHSPSRPHDQSQSQSPHISRRTASAVVYALEEAIRTPFPFTPDLDEENASMAELTGMAGGASGRGSSNGGSRTTGPVPVPQYSATGVRGPRDIMRERQAREARRRAETEAREKERDDEEQRRVQEERRRSAERRAVAAGVAGGGAVGGAGDRGEYRGGPAAAAAAAATTTAGDAVAQGHGGERRPGDRAPMGAASATGRRRESQAPGVNAASDRPPEELPPSRAPATSASNGQRVVSGSSTRPRGPSVSQSQAQPQPRPAPGQQSAGTSQDPQAQPQTQRSQIRPVTGTGQSSQAQAGASAAPSASQPTQGGGAQDGVQQRPAATASSFPHAFERWETLSSHWEGLTSYWIRRLEQNSDEVRREPLAQQMSRQITDLSAAGANLFHAVVELQRLRASSERKFQRWFFETRTEQERAAELHGELETTLRRERAQRVEAVGVAARAEKDKVTAETMVEEMRRELQISKEEARRAWEELGRREQEEIERTRSLREGQPTLVGGVQVVPMTQGSLSRHNSVNQPPTTTTAAGAGDAPYQGAAARAGGVGSQAGSEDYGPSSVGGQDFAEYESSVGTEDPFLEAARPGRASASEGGTTSADAQRSSARGAYAPASQEAFAPSQAASTVSSAPSSHGPYPQASAAAAPTPFYQHGGTSIHEAAPAQADSRSYASRPSDDATFSDEEYEIDEQGQYRLDAHGQRILYRRGVGSEGSDDYDVREDLERERAHAARYGGGASGGGGYVPGSTSTAAAAGRGGGWGAPGQADYSGAGYGAGSGWENVPRHHNPTRLSDVLEEDERSRTSASRASLTSRR
ncbi:MAG: hypothetical protein M1832_003340 [Thelocarpon impressellum]|nr:MAG: hypothetical protein M1832_003340 [Thelocarpon impressellum]